MAAFITPSAIPVSWSRPAQAPPPRSIATARRARTAYIRADAGRPGPSAEDASLQASAVVAAIAAATAAMSPEAVMALDLQELFKTTPANLAHPLAMWGVFGGAVYTFYLGYKASQVRKVDAEKRKELVKGKFGQKHFATSSALLAIMTIATFEGMANTYNRAGKLFPGPHLYAGLGLVALMTVMASFVPSMQKGENWARDVHFSLAFVAVGLFAWQAQTGMQIVGKILGWS
mmetsp:Transcript_12945/g.32013  ORF Transcript_12945/g.32013 Transcript_12945/m.32013 type:complete len:232 (-) Transcript_12945:129-824(-)